MLIDAMNDDEVYLHVDRDAMRQAISLMVVSDHRFFGECLILSLRKCAVLSVHDLVRNEATALHKMEARAPDVVLLDWHLMDQGALKLSRHFSQAYPKVKVLIFGVAELEAEIRECVEAGAHGYLVKQASFDDLRQLIELVARGETVCSPHIAHALFSRLSELARSPGGDEAQEPMPLTSREVEILAYVAKGWSNSQIADYLCLSLHTVKNHVHNMLKKLQVDRRLEAVEYAKQRRWLNHYNL